MRILFIVWDYPSESFPGAAPFHRTAAEALSRQGMDVEVMAPVPWLPNALRHRSPKAALPYRTVDNGISVCRPRFLRLPRPFLVRSCEWAMEKAIRRAIDEKPDIIHSHFAYPYGRIGLSIGRERRIPTVVTLHGSDVNGWPVFPEWLRQRSSETIRESDAVVAVSESLSKKTLDLTGRSVPVCRIGINLRKYHELPDQAVARKMLDLPLDKKLVLYAGLFKAEKGISELVRSLELLGDKELLGVVVGDGPLRPQVEQSKYCRTDGFVPNERIPLYMRTADVFALPSYTEGMPTVLVEAGAAALPVVATSVGGIPELLAEDRGLQIEPRSPDELAKALKSVFHDPAAASQRASRLQHTVYSQFDADKNAELLVETYEELVDSKLQMNRSRVPLTVAQQAAE